MIPWKLIDTAQIPGNGGKLQLHQRNTEFSISIVGGGVLMSTRAHGSEEALAEVACSKIAGRLHLRILIGGLGMGFTLAAALRQLEEDAEVIVAELVPAVLKWNRDYLGEHAGHPLRDKRTFGIDCQVLWGVSSSLKKIIVGIKGTRRPDPVSTHFPFIKLPLFVWKRTWANQKPACGNAKSKYCITKNEYPMWGLIVEDGL